MRDTSLLQLAARGPETVYRVSLLCDPELDKRGVRHRGPHGEPVWLDWRQIRTAFAAEVGEPEGVRTVVFDLVSGPEGTAPARGDVKTFCVFRLDAEPGEAAMAAATAISNALGAGASASVKGLADEGTCSNWYQDVDEFEVAAIASLMSR